jgi:hypothetical protein
MWKMKLSIFHFTIDCVYRISGNPRGFLVFSTNLADRKVDQRCIYALVEEELVVSKWYVVHCTSIVDAVNTHSNSIKSRQTLQ